MTGEPEFTFRDSDNQPLCPECGGSMQLEKTVEDRLGETDHYICPDCGTDVTDSWTF